MTRLWTTTGARGRLRAADPAEPGLAGDLWPSATARGTLERIVADTGAASGSRIDVPDTAAGHRQRQRRLLPIAATIVVVFVAAGVALLRTTSGSGGPHRPAVGVGVSDVPPARAGSNAANKAAALAAVAKLLAEVPALPGATSVGSLPDVPFLSSQLGSPNLVEKSAFWTAPGTMKAAIGYVRAHLPPGWSVGGAGWFSQSHGATTSEELTLDVPAPNSSGVYAQLQAQVAVASYHGGVAMTAEAQAIWLPTRTATEQIPATATSVNVTITRPGRDTIRRTLTGDALRKLAAAVNAQPVATPLGPHGCLRGTGELKDALTFHAPGGTVTVTVWRNGCSGVTVTADGRAQPDLNGLDAIDAAVIDALDLPSAYRIN